jgi:hypothetical protein
MDNLEVIVIEEIVKVGLDPLHEFITGHLSTSPFVVGSHTKLLDNTLTDSSNKGPDKSDKTTRKAENYGQDKRIHQPGVKGFSFPASPIPGVFVPITIGN